MADNIAHESRLHTDGSKLYVGTADFMFRHETVNHADKEYGRPSGGWVEGEYWPKVTTNTAEGYFSIFKRGMQGVYQHCSEKHLHRYVTEFDFRYSRREALGWNDEARCIAAIRGAEGKRLTYHQPLSA